MVAIVMTSAADDRIENSSLRSTAVPITAKLISVATVVSAHTAGSNTPSSGPQKYAVKPHAQRNHSIAITRRSSRWWVRARARAPSTNTSTVAGVKNTSSASALVQLVELAGSVAASTIT